LERLGMPFEVAPPGVDEARRSGEAPAELASRLAREKAGSIARTRNSALVIGSDQVAFLDGEILGKPGDHANAPQQLRRLSGRTASFVTALCLHNSRSGMVNSRLVPFEVTFRTLSDQTIARYLAREQPYDCAGSAKA